MEENKITEEEKIVPNYALDIINANHNATLKRLWILVFVLVFLLVGTNLAWVIYESQFEDVTTTVTQEVDSGEGGTATINDGVHINDESKTNSNNKKANEEST